MTDPSTPPTGRDPLTGALTDIPPTDPDVLMAEDSDLSRAMAVFLATDGYSGIKEWAEDSDFYYEPLSGEWYSHEHPPGGQVRRP